MIGSLSGLELITLRTVLVVFLFDMGSQSNLWAVSSPASLCWTMMIFFELGLLIPKPSNFSHVALEIMRHELGYSFKNGLL